MSSAEARYTRLLEIHAHCSSRSNRSLRRTTVTRSRDAIWVFAVNSSPTFMSGWTRSASLLANLLDPVDSFTSYPVTVPGLQTPYRSSGTYLKSLNFRRVHIRPIDSEELSQRQRSKLPIPKSMIRARTICCTDEIAFLKWSSQM